MAVYRKCFKCSKYKNADVMVRIYVPSEKGKGHYKWFCCRDHAIEVVGREYFE